MDDGAGEDSTAENEADDDKSKGDKLGLFFCFDCLTVFLIALTGKKVAPLIASKKVLVKRSKPCLLAPR